MLNYRLLAQFPVAFTSVSITFVLFWIGLFKFTPTEAAGIEPLVRNSPLMSWMYGLFSEQMTSNIIGTSEIITATLLVVALFFPPVGLWASGLSALIFFTTSTFLFTTSGIVEKIDGLWVPSDLGSFLMKDLIALGASLMLIVYYMVILPALP